MSTARFAFMLFSISVYFACSGDVNVHGVPKEIQLDAPFCAPSPSPKPVDAGFDGENDAELQDD